MRDPISEEEEMLERVCLLYERVRNCEFVGTDFEMSLKKGMTSSQKRRFRSAADQQQPTFVCSFLYLVCLALASFL